MTIPVIDSILQKKDFQLRLAGEQGKLRNLQEKKIETHILLNL